MRLTLRSQPPDQCPVLQGDHSPIVVECSLFTVETVQFSTVADTVRSRTESLRRRPVGAAQPNLSKGLVLTEPIPVPDDLDEQVQWRAMLDSVRDAELAQQATKARLGDLRSHLLAALLSGEHEIPESYDELMEESP